MNNKIIKFPMNSQKKFMQDKKCDYKTLAIMTLYSNHTPIEHQHETGNYEPYRYLYRDKIIEFTEEIEGLSKNKISTVLKNMKKLSTISDDFVLAYKNKNEKIYYVIRYCDDNDRQFVTIDEDMLKYLVWSSNSNTIKTYILIKYLCQHEKEKYNNNEKKITNEYICEQIGLSPNSKNNLQGIGIITDSLENNGFINKRYVNCGGIKSVIYYSVNTHEEWIKIHQEKKKKCYRSVNEI